VNQDLANYGLGAWRWGLRGGGSQPLADFCEAFELIFIFLKDIKIKGDRDLWPAQPHSHPLLRLFAGTCHR
jgi:hypothetical protein